MDPEPPAIEPELPRTLAAASPCGHRVELLEYPDGRIVIMFDGVEYAVYQSGMSNVEACIKSYLGLHRSCEAGVKP